jgi:hypothetical protein
VSGFVRPRPIAVPFARKDAMNAIMPISSPRGDTTNQHVKFGALRMRLAARRTEKSKIKRKRKKKLIHIYMECITNLIRSLKKDITQIMPNAVFRCGEIFAATVGQPRWRVV